MSLRVVRAGLLATIQDAGRPGWRGYGVPVGGWFDGRSAGLANALVGNGAGAAVLEETLRGGVYEAEADLALGLAGAHMEAWVQSDKARPVRIPGSITLRAGERLVLGPTLAGARTYVAVAGGWLRPVVLGSRSSEEALKEGDLLEARAGTTVAARHPRQAFDVEVDPTDGIRVVDGTDTLLECLPVSGWEGVGFRVSSRSDRMGVRLEGPEVGLEVSADRLSAPVDAGAVQVAGGQLIVLGVACGTMGGYPHLAHVIAADLPLVGQMRPGQTVRLKRVSVEEARRIDREEWQQREEMLFRIRLMAGDKME